MRQLIINRTQSIKQRTSQRGASLIEALVAIVILAVGLLGMAGMTAASIKYNQTSRMRGTGVLLVNDLAERARINIVGFNGGGYEKKDTYSFSSTLTDPTGCTNAAVCSAAGLATYDLNQWLQNVSNRLPGGSAYITTATANGIRTMNVSLIWAEPSDLEDNLTQTCPANALPKTGDTTGIRCMNFRVTL